jgi:ATP-dependent protease ClpP protease subunit
MPLLSTEELTPPEAVQREALKGVALHEAGKSGDGIKPETIRRANSIANGEPQSEQWVTSEAPAWFARHEADWEEGVDDVEGKESPGYVAWLLWGGDAGSEWVEEMQQLYLVRRAQEEGSVPSPGVSALAVEPSHLASMAQAKGKRYIEGALGTMHVDGPLYPIDYYSMRLDLKRAQLQGEKVMVMHVDSPGGYVAGVRETRRAIARAQEQGIYVLAYVSGMAASAALWLAAAADEVVLSPLAQAGSVGVVVTLARDGEEGSTVEVVSSQTPRKRASTNDSDYIAALQRRVDQLASIMLSEIAADRGVAVESLGDGSVYAADEAVARGLADRIATNADDWMFLGGSMPLDYQRRVRTVTASASISDGDREAPMGDENTTAQAVDNAALGEVERLQAELQAAREQLAAVEQAAHKAQDELLRRDAVAMVETHVVGGRIPQAKRGEWVERAMRMGIDEVAGMLADLSPIVAVAAPVGHGGAAADAVSEDPRAAEVRRANDMLARVRAGRGV